MLDEWSTEICTACIGQRKLGSQEPCNCAGDRTRKANATRNTLLIHFLRYLRSSWSVPWKWGWTCAETWHTMLLPAGHGQDSIDPALQTHSASDSEPSPNVVRFAGHLRHWLRPVAFWYRPKGASLARRCPELLWDPLRNIVVWPTFSNPGMNSMKFIWNANAQL